MADNATLNINDKKYEFPITKGTEGEIGIDIKTLRADSEGVITLDPGFKNTGACQSAVTFLDGEKSILRYRGYSIEDLADKADFLEVTYLLIYGELPNKEQLEKFQNDIAEEAHVDERMKTILKGFPSKGKPMGVLTSLTSALESFYTDLVTYKSEEDMDKAIIKVLGKFPILAAWTLRNYHEEELVAYDKNLGYVENFLQMMFKKSGEEYKVEKTVVEAFNKLLILHADHEQNCSTSTVRMVGSSNASLFASLAAGVAALSGPLHGGANERVVHMLEGIKDDDGDTARYMEKAKDKNDPFRLMGFGHRVYKNFDPRAKIIKKSADDVLGELGIEDPVLTIAENLEKEALQDDYFIQRKLYPNVDFYSGIIYRALGIPTELFTVMFAMGRLPGWIGQWREMRLRKEPIGRPRQIYIGENERAYKKLEDR